MGQVDRPVVTAARVADPSKTADARSAPRVQASAVPTIKGVRLSPFGADATLLNISTTGVLVECTNRLRLGTTVTTVFDGTFSPASVEGHVARSSVASVSKNGVLRYHIGIAFNSPIPLEHAPAPANRQPEAAPQAQMATPAASPLNANRW